MHARNKNIHIMYPHNKKNEKTAGIHNVHFFVHIYTWDTLFEYPTYIYAQKRTEKTTKQTKIRFITLNVQNKGPNKISICTGEK